MIFAKFNDSTALSFWDISYSTADIGILTDMSKIRRIILII